MFTNRTQVESRTGGQHPNMRKLTSTHVRKTYKEAYTIEARTTQEIVNIHKDSPRPLCKRTLSSGRDGHEPPLAPWRQRTTAGRQTPAIPKPMKHHPDIATKTADRSSGGIARRPQRTALAPEHPRSTAVDCSRARQRSSTINQHKREVEDKKDAHNRLDTRTLAVQKRTKAAGRRAATPAAGANAYMTATECETNWKAVGVEVGKGSGWWGGRWRWRCGSA